MRTKSITHFLFPLVSFWTGVGSVLDLSGDYVEYNVSPSEAIADRRALTSDWWVVGQDIRCAANTVLSERKKASSLAL